MANQEFPLFALHRGNTLLADVMMPTSRAECGAGAASNTAAAKAPAGGLLDRLDLWFWRQRQREQEAYLAQAQDVFELESRMRSIGRGVGDALMPQGHHGLAPAKAAHSSLLDRLDAWFWRQRQRADESYLARSQDVFELERRMRELERSVGSRYY